MQAPDQRDHLPGFPHVDDGVPEIRRLFPVGYQVVVKGRGAFPEEPVNLINRLLLQNLVDAPGDVERACGGCPGFQFDLDMKLIPIGGRKELFREKSSSGDAHQWQNHRGGN